MRRLVLSLVVAAGLAVAPLAYAEQAALATDAAAPAKPAADDPDRVVCRREHVVGSNRPKKVCMTVAQRAALKDAADRVFDPGRRTPGGAELVQQNGQ